MASQLIISIVYDSRHIYFIDKKYLYINIKIRGEMSLFVQIIQ